MIKIYRSFLEDKFLNKLKIKLNEKMNNLNPIWTSNLGWDSKIVKSSSPILIHQIKDQEDINYICDRYKKIKYKFRDLTVCFYYWPKGSYIPFHNDNHPRYQSGSTIYLNKNWEPDWGGFYLWKDNDNKYHAELPEYNKMILNDCFTFHGTSLVSNDALEARMTLQIFFLK